MEDKDLEKMLEEDIIDIPEISINEKYIINRCKEKKKQDKKKIVRLSIALSSFVLASIIVLVIVLSINKTPAYIKDINESIYNLEKIDDDEIKMNEIINIDKKINEISKTDQEKIDKAKLNSELEKCVNALKNKVKWKECIDIDSNSSYYLIDSLIEYNEVNRIKIVKGAFSQSTSVYRIADELFKTNLYPVIDLAYIDVSSDEDIAKIKKMLTEETVVNETYNMTFMTVDTNNISVFISQSGYIVLDIFYDEPVGYKKFISLTKVNLESLEKEFDKEKLSSYSTYLNPANEVELLTEEYLNNHTITFMSVTYGVASSYIAFINNKDDIDEIFSMINVETDEFYVVDYEGIGVEHFGSTNRMYISMECKTNDGEVEHWGCSVSKEGALGFYCNATKQWFYTNENMVDYKQIDQYIRECSKHQDLL